MLVWCCEVIVLPQRKLRTAKTKRIVLRSTEEQELAFEQAALVEQTTVSQFVCNSALVAAYAAIREQHVSSVSEEHWNSICNALDNPPKHNQALHKLLKSQSIFENR